HSGAGGDPSEDPLLGGESSSGVNGLVDIDVEHLVVNLGVQNFGHKVRADALDLVRSGLPAGQDRGLFGLHRDDLDIGLAFLQQLPRACDGASGADSGDEVVNLAVGVRPNLLTGGGSVDGHVGGVGALPSQDGAGAFGG